MATINQFEDLETWQKARMLSNKVYELTLKGSFSRDFKLRDQINGATGSIMDNIAEGFEREGTNEFIQALSYSKGSAGETRSQLIRAHDRRHITNEDFEQLKLEILTISKMISRLIGYLKHSGLRGTKFKDRQK
jgi:four helix bundle protein